MRLFNLLSCDQSGSGRGRGRGESDDCVTFTTFSSRPLVGIWLLLALTLVGLDQAIKYVIQVLISLNASIKITSFFNLAYVLNPGAAFSFLADAGGWQRYFFIGLGLAVSVLLAFTLWRGVRNRLETAAYISLIGGALGNVIDRLRIGAVVDYLDFHWSGWHWPAFNLADVFVIGGAGLLFLASLASQEGSSRRGVDKMPRRPLTGDQNGGSNS